MSSHWNDLQIEQHITAVLTAAAEQLEEHHFGPPFLSAYQLAIELAQRQPEAVAALGLPVGGAGVGQHSSLAQYLARELSRRIHLGQITHVEGAFLSNWHVADFVFHDGHQEIRSSLTAAQINTSLFRLRGDAG